MSDDLDLRLAFNELAAGREMLREAHGTGKYKSRERREAIKTALARLALAARAIDEVVMRRGGICGDCLDG